MRDNRTEEAKRHIGEGAKVRMDEKGNIHIKRVAKSNIYIKNTADENAIGNDILKLPQGALEFGKGYLVGLIEIYCNKNKSKNLMKCCLFAYGAVVWHEKVPTERFTRTETRLPGPA